jgi:hypothetical protein
LLNIIHHHMHMNTSLHDSMTTRRHQLTTWCQVQRATHTYTQILTMTQ